MEKNLRKRQSPYNKTDLAIIPAKRVNLTGLVNDDHFTKLPERILTLILGKCSISDLSNLALVCKKMNDTTLSFLMSPFSTKVAFPFLAPFPDDDAENLDQEVAAGKLLMCVSGKSHIATINMAKNSFVNLGKAFKKMTASIPDIATKIQMACNFLERLEVELLADDCFVQTKHLLSWYGVFFHKLVRGWTKQDCYEASRLLVQFVKQHRLEDILSESYDIGSCPGVEIFYKHFFNLIFIKEVQQFGRLLKTPENFDESISKWSFTSNKVEWLEFLLHHTAQCKPKIAAKIFLLMSSASKEDISHHQYGIQWSDHLEAIPANHGVASSRYFKLVGLLNLVKISCFSNQLPDILSNIFTIPSPWLPENIGSVLLLLGEDVTSKYVKFLSDGCINCLNKTLSASLVGISVMTIRFKWSFHQFAFSRTEEALRLVSPELREGFIQALWNGFSGEITDLRFAAAQGEDWAQEGGKYLFSAVQMMGTLMMKKAVGLNAGPRARIEE